MPPTGTSKQQQQDFALRTLRRAVQLHSAKRAGATAAVDFRGTQSLLRPRSMLGMRSQGDSLGLASQFQSSQSQHLPDATQPASASDLARNKVPTSCGNEVSATMSTQTPSNLGLSANSQMSQPCSQQPHPAAAAAAAALSQPLLGGLAGRSLPGFFQQGWQQGASQGAAPSQPHPASQPNAPSQPPPPSQDAASAEPAQAKLATGGFSADVAAAATALVAALAGRSRSTGDQHRDERESSPPARGRHRSPQRSPPRPRRRMRCKAPPPRSTSSSSSRYVDSRRRTDRRRRSCTPPAKAARYRDDELSPPRIERARSSRADGRLSADCALPSRSDLVQLAKAASAASAAALGDLAHGMRAANQEHLQQLGSGFRRREAQQVLTLAAEYKRVCQESDAMLDDVAKAVESALNAAEGAVATASASGLAALRQSSSSQRLPSSLAALPSGLPTAPVRGRRRAIDGVAATKR
eukprot:TRINITY_DN11990_c0_g1_i1.p1 TRINITY_DN11990_c0_g1~~TRINITY_DN11990_c0_g1_i1.p1  ORF type:complete len:468 (+),score=95.23 TRINITY_DN11990_c0_g1_i1:90-1493(+)